MVAAGDPIESSDITTITDYTTGKPLVRLIQGSAQSISDATQTAIQFAATDDIDTHGFHDPVTNNTRITPTIAGYYRLKGTYFTGAKADFATIDCAIGKNGTSVAPADRRSFSTAATQVSNATSVQCEAILSANGSTDYFELIAFQDNAANTATNTNASGRFSCVLECEFIRPL